MVFFVSICALLSFRCRLKILHGPGRGQIFYLGSEGVSSIRPESISEIAGDGTECERIGTELCKADVYGMMRA